MKTDGPSEPLPDGLTQADRRLSVTPNTGPKFHRAISWYSNQLGPLEGWSWKP